MNQDLLQQNYKRSPDFIPRKIAGEIVLVPLHRHTETMRHIYSLNETGSLVWDYLEKMSSAQKIKNVLVSEFDADSATIENDLRELLKDLLEIKAITPA